MEVDAVVVGSGPNGLTAAITLAQAGLAVQVYEAKSQVGGGARTEELTLPGFRHDTGSAAHPLGFGSPAFRDMPLDRYGLRWVQPLVAMAQTVGDGSVALLSRNLDETAASLGADGPAYRRLMAPFLGRWDELARDILRPPGDRLPGSPLLAARFGLPSLLPSRILARRFREERARALLAGMAAHVLAPLSSPVTGGVALMFALAGHDVGWPFPEGGAQGLSDALAAYLRALGGEIIVDRPVASLRELPSAHAYFLDVSPRGLATMASDELPRRRVRRLERYRYGPGTFKVDYALEGPMPWKNPACERAGSVHVGASADEIHASLRAANEGSAPTAPFLVTSQPTLFDPTRAPAGKHVLWAYTHVPNGWTGDALPAVEAQLERFAPGFRDLVLARHVTAPADLAAYNPNNVGGNLTVGRCDGLRGMVRPSLLSPRTPYATGNPAVFLCSSATSPGPGVHGMCGYNAARVALWRRFGRQVGGA